MTPARPLKEIVICWVKVVTGKRVVVQVGCANDRDKMGKREPSRLRNEIEWGMEAGGVEEERERRRLRYPSQMARIMTLLLLFSWTIGQPGRVMARRSEQELDDQAPSDHWTVPVSMGMRIGVHW